MTGLLLSIGTGGIVGLSLLGALLVAFIIYLIFVPMKSWITALLGGAYIPTFKLLGMKNRKLDTTVIANAYVMVKKSKMGIKLAQIESLVQAGVNPDEVIKALKLASDSGIKLSFDLASAIELANRSVVACVQDALSSKVVAVDNIRGFTVDGKEIIASAKVSVKLSIENYVNGLGIEDLQTTVNAWLLENISHCKNYKTLLSDPNKTLLSNVDLRVLGKKSMYKVLDIAVARVEVGRDLNVEKEIQMAEKDKIYAQIEAERMKNAEEIKELQMRSKTEAMKAAVLEAESEVPKALSQAIKEGRFSVMDYYKLMNLQADTALRKSIMTGEEKKPDFDFDDGEGDLFE